MPVVSAAAASKGAKELVNRRYMNPSRVWGYSWGYAGLNDLTGGIQHATPREYAVVAARSNIGKSAFGMTVALTVAFQFAQKYPDREVRICLLEMDAVTCELRLASQLTGIPIKSINRGEITSEEKARLDTALDKLALLPLVYAEGSYSINYIEEFVSKINRDTGLKCGWWLLDHIGIVPTKAAAATNQSFSLGELSLRFQALCHSQAPGMVLAQLNRDVYKSKDGKPTIAHVYGSDRPVQDSDITILLDRPETRIQMSDEEKAERKKAGKPEVATLIVAKQRNGDIGEVPVLFHPKRALWADIPPEVLRKVSVA